jgi:hypothetical protein
MEHQQLHKLHTAADLAKERLETYLTEKLRAGRGHVDDREAWEFWTYLLEKAKNHRIYTSGFTPSGYNSDHAEAVVNLRRDHPEYF